MTALSETRVGWCPGALRPMASRDGFIVRVKPRGATLAPHQAIGIAAAARNFGNGALDLTSRANLQIRGASDGSLPALTEALDRLGLLDPDVGAETRRNVMMSPLAGFDSKALLDVRPVVAALEDRLAADGGLAGVPAKFGFAVSDGGRLPLGDVGADVTFDAMSLPGPRKAARSAGWGGAAELPVPVTPPDTLRVPPSPPRGRIIQVRLAGDADTVASCPVESVPEVAARLASWFIAARGADPDLRRMRQAVDRFGASAILTAVGLQAERWSCPRPSWPGSSRPPAPTDAVPGMEEEGGSGVGHFALRADGHVLGIAAPFGRLDAAQLGALAQGALRAGASELRLTPWRTILVPGLTRSAAKRLGADCVAVGLVADPTDPRLRVAACSGAPGCHRGTTPVLDDAARFATLLGRGHVDDGIVLHVSGCAKGCAHPGPAPVTLVADNGHYRLVLHGPPGLDPDAVRALRDAAGEGRAP